MSRAETIQKLEALLERVRTRSAGPRPRPSHSPAEPEVVEPPVVAPELAAVVPIAEQRGAGEDPDSRERLVAAESAATETAPAGASARGPESVPPIDVAELEVTAEVEVAAEEAEEEVEERAPASSRRPVAPEPEERLAQIAFGAEEPLQPLHTPPPESGRLPAAPGAQFEDPDFTSVRSATPLLPRRVEALPRGIEPEAVRPERAPSDAVGEVVAEAQRFAPQTFVALLDASLSL